MKKTNNFLSTFFQLMPGFILFLIIIPVKSFFLLWRKRFLETVLILWWQRQIIVSINQPIFFCCLDPAIFVCIQFFFRNIIILISFTSFINYNIVPTYYKKCLCSLLGTCSIFKLQNKYVKSMNIENAPFLIKRYSSKLDWYIVKSRAVDRSTIQFWTILGVLLTETCYYSSRCRLY